MKPKKSNHPSEKQKIEECFNIIMDQQRLEISQRARNLPKRDIDFGRIDAYAKIVTVVTEGIALDMFPKHRRPGVTRP